MQPLLVRDGAVLDGLTVPLYHGSAIAGRILDAYGDPVDMAQVRALRVGRGERPAAADQTQTNDLGEFRLARMQPGRYLLQVRPPMRQMFYFQNPNMIDDMPLPQPLPTYYPSVLAMAQAQPIAVGRGETVSGVEIVLGEGTPAVVTGTVLRLDGQPVTNGSLNSRVVGADAVTGGYDSSGGTGIRQGGAFRIALPPGEYLLEAHVMTRQGPGPMGPEDQLAGSTRINVRWRPRGGDDHGGPRRDRSGRVVFEGTTPPPPSPGQAHAPLYNPEGPGCRSGQATIAADWTFKLEGLSGTCGAPPAGRVRAMDPQGGDLPRRRI